MLIKNFIFEIVKLLKHTNRIETFNMTVMQGVIIQLVLLFQHFGKIQINFILLYYIMYLYFMCILNQQGVTIFTFKL